MQTTPENVGLLIAREAETWVGTPFAVGGRDRHGVDCASLLLVIARALHLSGYDPGNYSLEDGPRRFRAELARVCDRVTGPLQPGDIVLLTKKGSESHLGIIAEDGGLIHARNTAVVRRVTKNALNATLRGRITAVYRWREGAPDG